MVCKYFKLDVLKYTIQFMIKYTSDKCFGEIRLVYLNCLRIRWIWAMENRSVMGSSKVRVKSTEGLT